MKRWSALSSALLLVGFAAFSYSHHASAADGWVTLFDGKNLDNVNQIGNANWHLEDGSVHMAIAGACVFADPPPTVMTTRMRPAARPTRSQRRSLAVNGELKETTAMSLAMTPQKFLPRSAVGSRPTLPGLPGFRTSPGRPFVEAAIEPRIQPCHAGP